MDDQLFEISARLLISVVYFFRKRFCVRKLKISVGLVEFVVVDAAAVVIIIIFFRFQIEKAFGYGDIHFDASSSGFGICFSIWLMVSISVVQNRSILNTIVPLNWIRFCCSSTFSFFVLVLLNTMFPRFSVEFILPTSIQFRHTCTTASEFECYFARIGIVFENVLFFLLLLFYRHFRFRREQFSQNSKTDIRFVVSATTRRGHSSCTLLQRQLFGC